MMKLKVLALLGIVAVLGMTGCGKKKHHNARRDERHEMRRDHRAKKHMKKDRKAKREMHREERDMFAK